MKKTKTTSAAEKRRLLVEQRRNKQLKFVSALLLIAILAEGLFILAKSDYLDVRRIDIRGNNRVTTARLAKLAGLTTKTNIFDFSAAEITKRLLSEPWIRSATVARKLPLRVIISVTERQPAAVVLMGGRFYLVDKGAAIIEGKDANVYPGQTVIADAPYEDKKEAGEDFAGPSIRNALAALGGLDKDLALAVESMTAPSIDGMSFKLKGGPIVMYGKSEMIRQKNYAIKVILKEAANEGKSWQYIDVRVPSNPAAKAAT